MYLYFSDWSDYMSVLDEKGMSHGDKIIKVYACENDPRVILNKPNLFVINGDGGPFKEDEIFHYPGRKSYTGSELEEDLTNTGINDTAKRYFRAVFRFDNSPEAQSNQCMMAMKNPDGTWAYQHPFESIDGIDLALKQPELRSVAIHADIFDASSLEKLGAVVDLDDKELVATTFDVLKVVKQESAAQSKEGNFSTIERA